MTEIVRLPNPTNIPAFKDGDWTTQKADAISVTERQEEKVRIKIFRCVGSDYEEVGGCLISSSYLTGLIMAAPKIN